MRVPVIGAGSVAAITGACLSYLGHRVTCLFRRPGGGDFSGRKCADLWAESKTTFRLEGTAAG